MQFVSQKNWFYKRFTKQSKNIKLGFNSLYIFPNLFGFYWILATIVLYILGTNLEINFTIFISYLMLTVIILSLFLTHFNIHGLELISTNQRIFFANSTIYYEIIINSNTYRKNIKIKFIGKRNKFTLIEKVEGQIRKSLILEKKQRGIYNPDTIYGISSSPLSLFNCWFYWKPFNKLIVAPEKKKGPLKVQYISNNNDSQNNELKNNTGDELNEITYYQKGEKKSLIHWKSLSRSKNLLSKKFNSSTSEYKWLFLNENLPLEESLEHLSFEIHNQYINNKIYGLRLTKEYFISPDSGYKHYLKCLKTLAIFK